MSISEEPISPRFRLLLGPDDDYVMAFVLTEKAIDALDAEQDRDEMDWQEDIMEKIRNRTFDAQTDSSQLEWRIRANTEAVLNSLEGPLCPLCGWRAATDLHEIVSRRRVQGNTGALLTVFSSYILCVKVCRECHPKGNDETNKALMQYKLALYGKEEVWEALAEVNSFLEVPLMPAELGVCLDEL